MPIKKCIVCGNTFKTQTTGVYCKTGNSGKCKKIGQRLKNQRTHKTKPINPFFLKRGNISGSRIDFSSIQS